MCVLKGVLKVCVQVRERVPQGADELPEAGPGVRLVGPAAGEQGVDGGRAVLWFGESNSRLQLVDHLPVLQPEERLLGHREDLPHTHAWLNTHTRSDVLVLIMIKII